ncbi:MAG: PorT family protein [Thermoflexibacter sp.]|jgi:hypothetical protein|nr:PorT family protein [Thermoflexibacter sp.]
MKSLPIILLAFVFGFSKAQAQESKWRLGLRLSPMLSLVSITDGNKNALSEQYGVVKSARFGIAGGLQVTYQFTEKIGIQTGLQISQQSYLVKLRFVNFSNVDVWQQKSNFTMLNIPLALHLRTNELAGGLRARGTFGSSFNIPVAVSQEVTLPDRLIGLTPTVVTTKGTANYTKIVPYFLVGAGVEWNLGNAGTLDLGMSYHLPLAVTTNKFYENFGLSSNAQSPNRLKMSYVSWDIIYYF